MLSDVSSMQTASSPAAQRAAERKVVRRVWAVAFTAFFLLGAAWSLAMPYDGPADELQHVTRAYAVASGQIYVGTANSKVRTAQSLVPTHEGCFRWDIAITARCQQTPGADPAAEHTRTSYKSGAAGYNPSYYLLVGPVLHVWPNMKGIVLARLITDAEISALLACAVAVGWSGGRNRWLIAGITVCVTPVVVNMMGAVNPAGVEIGAAIAFWVSLLELVNAKRIRTPVVALLVCSGVLLAVTRGFGVGWLGATVVICAFGAERERLRTLLRTRSMWYAAAGIACACAVAVAWDLLAGANYDLSGATSVPTSALQLAGQELWDRLPYYMDGTVRLTSYGDIPVPQVVSQIWFGFTGLIVLGALWLGSVRAKIQIAASILVSLGMLMVSDADAVRQGFWFSQGRYALPLLVGAPLIAALELGRLGVFSTERAATLLRWMAVGLLPLQLVALYASMLRFQRGFPLNSNVLPLNPFIGKWLPPLGPAVPLALMVLGLAVFAWCLWQPPRVDATVLRFAAVGALVYGIDISALWVLHSVAGMPLAVATTLAFCCAFVANLTLNRIFTFRVSGSMGRQGARLLVLSGLNYVSTLVIVLGLSHVWSAYLMSKTIATAVNAVFNYFVYRRWVFERVDGPSTIAPVAPSADFPNVGSSAQKAETSLRGGLRRVASPEIRPGIDVSHDQPV